MDDYCWLSPDKRFTEYDIYLPGPIEGEDRPQIVFACDTSGSVGPEEKAIFAAEISGVLEEFPCKINVVYCDTDVRHTQDVDADSMPIELEVRGGGGTRFSPVFKYINKHKIEAQAILFFTDLCCSDFGKNPGVPVLWMNTHRGNDNMKVPFGTVIPLELDNEV